MPMFISYILYVDVEISVFLCHRQESYFLFGEIIRVRVQMLKV